MPAPRNHPSSTSASASTSTLTSSSFHRSTNTSTSAVRRNLFHAHLSRRPTTSSTSTSAETLRLDIDPREASSDIVVRDRNGEIEMAGLGILDAEHGDSEEGGEDAGEREFEKERQRLADMVKHHRDRNRAPSEPVELVEAVKAVLRVKVAGLSEDNWMYEAENITAPR